MEVTLFGAAVGLASGINPGPVLTLTVAATLERGFPAGARVAISPLITDAPLITICLVVLHQVPAAWLAALGLMGGIVVLVLGLKTGLAARRAELPSTTTEARQSDLWRGVLVNALNPNAWLFWVAVGAPLLLRTAPTRPWAAAGFVVAFYGGLVGSKLAVAALLAKGRHHLSVTGYRATMGLCAVLLVALGVLLLGRGWRELSAVLG